MFTRAESLENVLVTATSDSSAFNESAVGQAFHPYE